LARTSGRYLFRHPWQTGLALLGIALGVAVVIAIDISQHTAAESFARSTKTVAGAATHHIIGGPNGIDENVYIKLRRAGIVTTGANALAPLVDGPVTMVGHPGEPLRVLGIDPVAAVPFATQWQPDGGTRGPFPLGALMTRRSAIAMSAETGERLGTRPGDQITLETGAGLQKVEVAAWIETAATEQAALDGYLLADIATAQELLDRRGRLDRIDVILSEDADPNDLADLLDPSLQLLATGTRLQSVQSMTRAFNTNLTALSLLSLLVGMFLIYNTQTFLVLQRRDQFGVLRALGFQRRDLITMILTEALVLGCLGSALGVALGMGMAHFLLGYVSQTVNDLYYAVSLSTPATTPSRLLRGVALGIGATLIAAAAPAIEASRVSPRLAMSRASLEKKMRGALRILGIVGLVAIVAGLAAMMLPSKSIVAGFLSLFVVILGAAFVTPLLTTGLIHVLQPVATRGFGVLGKLATRTVTASLSRTGVAVAALMLAVATSIGVGLMINSFRTAVADWLGSALQADFYVAETRRTPRYTLNPKLMARLNSAPEIAAVSSARRVQIESNRGIDQVVAYQLAERAKADFRFKGKTQPKLWPLFDAGEAVLISEPYSYHHGLQTGDSVQLRTDRGERDFPILGVFFDYGSEQGLIAMSQRAYFRFWDDRELSGVAIYLAPDVDRKVGRAIVATIIGDSPIQIRASREVLEISLAVFDRTFAITGVLRTLAASIAFIGILGALMALQLERKAEFGLYRALGLTAGQIRCLVVSETGLMGLVAGVIAIPVGIMMAATLVFVINVRSFGWTMELALTPTILLGGFGLAVGAALLAGLYPAQYMATLKPAEALRTE